MQTCYNKECLDAIDQLVIYRHVHEESQHTDLKNERQLVDTSQGVVLLLCGAVK